MSKLGLREAIVEARRLFERGDPSAETPEQIWKMLSAVVFDIDLAADTLDVERKKLESERRPSAQAERAVDAARAMGLRPSGASWTEKGGLTLSFERCE